MTLKILIVVLIVVIEYVMFLYIRKINDDFNKK
jgi:hypothetical protein